MYRSGFGEHLVESRLELQVAAPEPPVCANLVVLGEPRFVEGLVVERPDVLGPSPPLAHLFSPIPPPPPAPGPPAERSSSGCIPAPCRGPPHRRSAQCWRG